MFNAVLFHFWMLLLLFHFTISVCHLSQLTIYNICWIQWPQHVSITTSRSVRLIQYGTCILFFYISNMYILLLLLHFISFVLVLVLYRILYVRTANHSAFIEITECNAHQPTIVVRQAKSICVAVAKNIFFFCSFDCIILLMGFCNFHLKCDINYIIEWIIIITVTIW